MDYLLASQNDKDDIKSLWAYAFNEQEPFLSSYFDNFWRHENAIMLSSKGGSLQAALQLIPYEIIMRDAKIRSSYIVGVSVAGKYRGRGLSKTLMCGALTEQKKRGEALSLLIPFNYGFYRKLGYELCYCLKQYSVAKDDIPKHEIVCKMRNMIPADFSELNNVYNSFCSDKNGYILRSEGDWEYIFMDVTSSGGFIYGAYEESHLTGYVSISKTSDKIYVREMAYLDSTSYTSLLGFLTSHFPHHDKFIFDMPENDTLGIFFAEPRLASAIRPTVMARVVDVCSALAPIDNGLLIGITDDFMQENSGVYKRESGGIVKTTLPPDVTMDIKTLTQLVTGFLSVHELSRAGRIRAGNDILKTLDRIYPKKTNYINHIMEE